MIKPIEYRFHELRTLIGHIVRCLQEDGRFVSVRCSKLPEEWVLSLVQRKHRVVAPFHHQNRLLHARRKISLVALARVWLFRELRPGAKGSQSD